MRNRLFNVFLVAVVGLFLPVQLFPQQTLAAVSGQVGAKADPRVENYLRLPMAFERQGGGSAERFVASGPGYSVGVQGGKVAIGVIANPAVLRPDAVRDPQATTARWRTLSLEFLGAKAPQAMPRGELPGKINRMHGKDSRKWELGLSTFERVAYPGLYPGIDVVYYGTQRQVEFDLVVKPGADPKSIRMKVGGASGLSLDDSGALSLATPEGGVKIALPKIYQEVAGKQKSIAGHFRLRGRDEVAFAVDSYDRTLPLVIDPTIIYSAMLGGGTSSTYSNGVAVDASGNILIAGYTYASDFPVVNPVQTSVTVTPDAFVSKINAAGTALVYSSYLGGSSLDYFQGITVDSTGAAWATGYTSSTDFPVLGAVQPSFGGGSYDAMVAKFSASGLLQYSSYLGGSGYDQGYGVAVDGADNAYVTGYSNGSFPTTAGVFQQASLGYDAFVVKFNSAGSRVYSTLVGGTNTDIAYAIAADSTGNAYVTGYSYSTSFPNAPAGGAQTVNNGNGDVFVAKLNTTGTALTYFTFLGGSAYETGKAIAVDSSGNAYIGGQTSSTGLATAGAAQSSLSGGQDGFIAKLNPAGTAFSYVTYFGGTRQDYLNGLSVDASGSVYVAGYTTSLNIPNVSAVQPVLPGNQVSLYQTLDSANTWAPLDTNLPGNVYDISPDPANSNTFIVLADTGIYRTTNSGASWTQQFSGGFASNGSIARSPANANVLYAANGFSVYKSGDGGLTWTFVANTPTQVTGIVADPVTATTVYGFYRFSGTAVYRSTDAGATWVSATSGLPSASSQVVSMVAAPDGSLYAAYYGYTLYKSANQGTSWVAISSGLPSPLYPGTHSLTVSGSTVYFASGNLFKTTNGGTTWVPGTNYVGAAEVFASPGNPSALYAVTYNGTVQYSGDGGSTWNPFGAGLPTVPTNWPLVVSPLSSGNAFLIASVNQSVFAAKLNAAGSAFTWSTYLGGTNGQQATAIAANGGGAVVTGYTNGSGFPVTSTALPTNTYGVFVTGFPIPPLPAR